MADLGEATSAADVVHICSPTSTHLSVALAALEAGRHVLVEKPIAPSVEATAALLALADQQGVLLCPVHQFPFQDGMRRALSLIDRIGPLVHVQFTMCSAGADGLDDEGRAQVASEILPHPLSLLVRLMPGRVGGTDWTVSQTVPGEVRAMTAIGSTTAAILVSMNGRPTVNRMEILGQRGTIEVDLFHGFSTFLDGRVSRMRKIVGPLTRAARLGRGASVNLVRRTWRREPAYPGLRRLVAGFYRAAFSSGDAPISAQEILEVATASERLTQTAASACYTA